MPVLRRMPLMADDHTISADAPPAISLEAAVALTGRSRRTWWRRIEEGAVAKLAPDARGRALLVFDEVRPAIGLALDDEDMAAILRADGGDAQAQAQVGALFALAALKEEASSSPLSLPAGEIAPKSRGGGNVMPQPPIGCNWRRHKKMPMPCIGWAYCTRPATAATTMNTWR